MNDTESAPHYFVWTMGAKDQQPLELPALVSRIKSGQVKAGSWIFSEPDGMWRRASEVPELRMFFEKSTAGKEKAESGGVSLKPGSLRRIKIFAEMDEGQLETFVRFVEVMKFPAFSTIVRKGENGDAMFLVLEGELRARTVIDERETTLSTLSPGDFFGEVAMLDHGPRSADVLANKDSLVLKIASSAVEKIVRESPEAAAPFLLALGKSLVGRTRNLTKRYEDTIHFSRAAANVDPNP